MLPDKDAGCHRTGFEKDCRVLVAEGRCKRWMQIQGMHPQTGEQINRWDCADNWIPLLLIDNAKHQRETCASVDRFNNDMVRMNGIVSAVQSMATALPPANAPVLLENGVGQNETNQD